MPDIRILIVEDDPIHASTLEMLVEELGYRVAGIADNAADALALVQATKPDLVLMDILLNGETDGIEAARIITDLGPRPLIFISTLRDRETFDRARKVKPHAFLSKPFDNLNVQHAIELALTNFHAPGTGARQWINDLLVSDCFFIKEKNLLLKVPLAEVEVVEAEEKYCTINTPSRKFVIRMSLSDIEAKLPADFLRVHRAFIINISKITRIDLGENAVTIAKHNVPIGKTFREALMERIRLLG